MNNALVMEPQVPDFEKLFAHRGGFAMAVAGLTAYAVTVIRKRSGLTKNGRIIAKLDAKDLVVHALSRLTECESFEDGEAVYLQLRRHIDNRVRTIKKQKAEPTLIPIATGGYEEDAEIAAEPEDENAENPADVAERTAEDELYKELLNETKKKYKPNSAEVALIDLVLDGWNDRQEIAELMRITPEQYDILVKRVGRVAQTMKEDTLRKKAL
jgi:hypothetical protein